jgi:hypothetical protein
MSVPTKDQPPVMHPTLGDLRLWYPAYEVYAALALPADGHFHGPHVATPVELTRVLEGLRWLEEKNPGSLDLLPTLDQLRVLIGASGEDADAVRAAHEGSPCHNLWHWIHGD